MQNKLGSLQRLGTITFGVQHTQPSGDRLKRLGFLLHVEFVGSRPCSKGFSPSTPVFRLPTTTNSKTWKRWTNSHSVDGSFSIKNYRVQYNRSGKSCSTFQMVTF